ncbi:variable large family protein [Borrelia persica]|uniref:variable large family protein n=1 Tax=Borrelia persica TaxID=44448 RepID=UPI00046364A2|nr:variable large family protein [Borrelia persica]
MIVISLVMVVIGCNNGVAELEKKNEFLSSIANLGRGFLDVFVAFGDMVSGTLGIKADTKKSDIGKYFSDIAKTMTSVKSKLKDVISENGNYPKVKEVVEQFITGTLDKIAAGGKEAAKGSTDNAIIGNAVKNVDAKSADVASVNVLVKGIKEIVDVVLKEGKADATKTGDTEQKSIGKLLGAKDNGGDEAQAAAASASIGAVSGADILQAIASSVEVGTGEIKIEEAKNAAEIATAKKEDNKEFGVASVKKDAVIAAGIALRAMANNGQLAAKNDDKYASAINGAVASAVNKALSTLIIAIRNTVDSGLKEINTVLATVKQEDKASEAAVSGQQ